MRWLYRSPSVIERLSPDEARHYAVREPHVQLGEGTSGVVCVRSGSAKEASRNERINDDKLIDPLDLDDLVRAARYL